MENFEFYSPTRVVFGRGEYKRIGALLPYKRVLLHYGGGSIKRNGVYEAVTQSLRENGVAFAELGGVTPNPTLPLVEEGIALCRKEKTECVLAVGGGSVIDSAKAIALGVWYKGGVWDYYLRGGEPAHEVLPVAAVLTIPAAGSEQSAHSVITHDGKKLGCGSDKLRPVVSVISPELFFTLPKEQIAYGVSDMMSHTFERYFTNTPRNDFTDALCEGTLRVMMKNALILMKDPRDYDAWAEIGFAGSVCHNGLLGMGREEDWACHAMEHEISAAYPFVAHGAGLAVLTPAWMERVKGVNPEIFQKFAEKVMGAADADAAIGKLRAFYADMGLAKDFKGLGVDAPDIRLMAQKAVQRPIGNLKRLQEQDVYEIYKAAL